MRRTYRWGIIGPGKIARKFAEAIPLAGNATLHAVASRDATRAYKFATEYGAKNWYNSYEALAEDPEIDAVYVSTSHAFHSELSVMCLRQSKAVLCEKPMALYYKQVSEMVETSRCHKTFLMEAMWTRFLPVMEKTLEIVRDGGIGEIHTVRADFGFNAPYDPESRLFNLVLGGGSLLDVGVYPLFLVLLLLGKPQMIRATGQLAASGADESCQAVLQYANGAKGMINSALNRQTQIIAEIEGSEGRIEIASPWYKTNALTWLRFGEQWKGITLAPLNNGFEYEIREVQHWLGQGFIESPRMPHSFSLLLSKTMDEIRSQIGVIYPGETINQGHL